MSDVRSQPLDARRVLSKVPEVTIFFWIIKVLCTTVGESAADYLNTTLNLGLTGTSLVTGVVLVGALVLQFRADRYAPVRYWVTVALLSVFGTLVTDNLTDHFGVALTTSTIVFSVLLGLTFLGWYLSEGSLSIHSIYTTRRESFYWLAVLFSFALGTATGDLVAENLGFGYSTTALMVAGLIALTALAWRLGLNPILSFWIAYVLTRPLGAAIGDLLAQPDSHGGLGWGTTVTSVVFLAAIGAVIVFLSVTKIDTGTGADSVEEHADTSKGGLLQTVIVLVVVLVVGVVGYNVRVNSLATDATSSSASGSGLGDLSSLRTITQSALDAVAAGNTSAAKKSADDLEREWDLSAPQLKPKDGAAWNVIDKKIDTVLSRLRAGQPDAASENQALQNLMTSLG